MYAYLLWFDEGSLGEKGLYEVSLILGLLDKLVL